MGRWAKLVPLALLLVVMPVLAQTPQPEDSPTALLIVEFQTGSITSATEEFIELYNRTDEPYPADELKLQYRSASGSDWSTKAQLDGELEPRGRFLIATNHLADGANIINGLGLAAAGGHIRLVENAAEGEVELDQVAWGTAQFALIAPAPAPAAGQSLKRSVDEDGELVDTNNDLQDFAVSGTPSPMSTPPLTEDAANPPAHDPADPTPESNGDNQPESGSTTNTSRRHFRLELSELFIDPDQPLTDAEDEFVEIYNPNAEAVDLEGYIIQTGSKYSYSFTIPNITISAKKYLAFYSLDSGLALSNSGGGARLLAPDKSPLYEAPVYEKAKSGTVWANISGVWQWSAKPTPNAPNQAAATASASRSGSSGNGRTYLSQGKTLGATDDGRNIYEEPPTAADNQVNTAVVAGVGAMALLYAGNEYRYDVANFFQKLKRYFASRRGGGA